MNDLLILPEQDYELLLRLRPPAHLRQELERAIVVSDEALPPDVVVVNSRVVYTDEKTGVRRMVTIAWPHEANDTEGRISVLAPVGSALLGLSAGQSIEWQFPDGKHRLRVEEVLGSEFIDRNQDRP
jgi:regulator of nucleoside diphosphate kinase